MESENEPTWDYLHCRSWILVTCRWVQIQVPLVGVVVKVLSWSNNNHLKASFSWTLSYKAYTIINADLKVWWVCLSLSYTTDYKPMFYLIPFYVSFYTFIFMYHFCIIWELHSLLHWNPNKQNINWFIIIKLELKTSLLFWCWVCNN